jgi:serine/threonine-protein kinase
MVTANIRLLCELGSGGMAKVWIAEHLALRTRIVVKFLSDEHIDDARTRSRFSREAAAASQVKSPHVVQMLDYGIALDGTPFIAMELLEGRDLHAHLYALGRLTPHETIVIVRQVSKALGKAHARGIVHRDIKPENIFLCDSLEDDSEPFVKLLDFGIAKGGQHAQLADHEMTQTGAIIGTPHFMSPEQIFGGAVDARSDLWSLGVVAFLCLTGAVPFTGRSVGEIALSVKTGQAPRPSELADLPPAIDAWFSRACARDPSTRFQTARDLADALAEAVGETCEPSGARRFSIPTPTPTPMPTQLVISVPPPNPEPIVAAAPAPARLLTALDAHPITIPNFRPRGRRTWIALTLVAALAVLVAVFARGRREDTSAKESTPPPPQDLSLEWKPVASATTTASAQPSAIAEVTPKPTTTPTPKPSAKPPKTTFKPKTKTPTKPIKSSSSPKHAKAR